MADLHKYKAHEILNKVLNSAETGLQVDIVSGAEYAEDSAHTSADTGNFVLGVRNDTLAALGGADGDYVPFQMNASGALYVEVATLPASTSTIEVVGDAAENAAAAGNPVLIGGRYDSSARTLGNGDVGAIALDADGAVQISDGGNTVTVDGTVDLGSTATAHLSEIEGAVETIEGAVDGTEIRVDIIAISAQGDGTYIGDIKFGESLPAGTNNIGDVDIASLPASTNTIEVVGDAAEDAAVAGNPVLSGGRHDASVRTLDDGDVGALALDPTGALYTREFLGQAGSILVTGTTNAVTTSVSGTKFVAIQFLEDTTFDAGSEGLVASTAGLWPDDNNASTTIDSNGGAVTGSEVFPQGMTIFGRWDGFKLDSGKVIGYLGYV